MENNTQNQSQNLTPKKSSKSVIATVAVIVIVLVIIAVFFGKGNPGATTGQTASSTMATSTTATTTPVISPVVSSASSTANSGPSLSAPSLIYSVYTDKKSYSQNDQIAMTISVLNNSAESKTFNFVNGCQGNYTIASFNLDQHIRCTPAPTSFVVPPHETESLKIVHYPSVYKLPIGTWPLSVEIIGYGGATIPALTITQ
jgi:hypothetical protein